MIFLFSRALSRANFFYSVSIFSTQLVLEGLGSSLVRSIYYVRLAQYTLHNYVFES